MSDEVYIAWPKTDEALPVVFGHEADATAYCDAGHAVGWHMTKVLDHAEARELIEREEG